MKNYLKFFLGFITVMLFLTVVVTGQSVQSFAKKVLSHNQTIGNEQNILKKGGMRVTNYGSPPFDNPNYYYAAIKTPPSGYHYVQAGLSPNGQKIVAEKYQDAVADPFFQNPEIVLMNSDGSGEITISGAIGGHLFGYMNPFWSDDGSTIGYLEVWDNAPNNLVTYTLTGSITAYLYVPDPLGDLSINNPDFLGSSKTTVVFWDNPPFGGGESDLYTWDSNTSTRTNITNSVGYKEYEPVSNAAGDKIVYWSGEEPINEPINTTHTLTYDGVNWNKDVGGFIPISDSYWPYWSTRADNYIGVTVMSTKDVNIYNSTGTLVSDPTGPGYSGGAGQKNFLGTGFEGPNGEMLMSSNANRGVTPGRDLLFATPRTKLYVNASIGNDLFPGTLNAPFATIGKAVTEAIAGGTINVAAGTYNQIVTVNKALTITGTGSPTVTKFILTATPVVITGFSVATIIDLGTGGSLQNAIDAAAPGGIVNIPTGTYPAFTIDNSVTINGNGANILNGSPAITVTVSNVTINNFTFNFGTSDFAIQVDPGLTNIAIHSCDFLTINAVDNQGVSIVNAEYNFWGTITESVLRAKLSHPLTVDYIPWWGDLGHTIPMLPPPLLNTPANNAFNVAPGTDFHWFSFPAPTVTYGIQVSTDPTFADGSQLKNYQENVIGSAFTPTLSRYFYNTNYYWRVRSEVGTFGTGGFYPSSWSTIWEFTTALPPVVLSSPIAPVLYANPTVFTWSVPAGTIISNINFTVEVSLTNFGGIVYSNFILGATTLTIPIPLAGTYYWRVRADAASQTETQSTVSAFTLTLPGPGLINPVNGLTGISILPTLTWNPVLGASSYKLYVYSGDPSLGGTAIYQVNQGTNTSKTFDALIANFPLNNGTEYWWKVTALDINSVEYPSSVFHFTTVSSITVTLSTPANGDIVYLSPVMLSWYLGSSSSGLTFIIQYKYSTLLPVDEHFWDDATNISTTSLNSTIPVLQGKTYYWRVLVRRTTPAEYVYYPAYNVYNTFTTAGGSSVTVYPSWPIGGATVYTNSPTLYWYLDQYSTGLTYYINYSQDPHTTLGVLDHSVLNIPTGSSNLYYTLVGLTPGATYYWQVQASYTAGGTTSSWSTVESFVTNGTGTPVVPIPSYPIGGVTVYSTSPTLYWYLPTAATGLYYDVLVADDATDFSGVHIKFSGTTAIDRLYIQVTGLTPGQTYYWVVKSHNSSGTSSAWSETPTVANATFTVAGGTTASYPVASYPIGNPTVYTNRPALSWYLEGSNLGITGYTIKYNKDSAPTWSTFTPGAPSATSGSYSTSASTFSKTIDVDLTYGGHYFWAVAATSGTTYSEGEFTIVGGSTAATIGLSDPADGSTVYSTSTTLYWFVNGSSAGIVNYTVQVSQSDVFASYFFNNTVTTSYKPLSGLTSGATYYWKVRANYADGTFTAYSSPWSFTVNTGSLSIVQPLVGGPNNVTVNTTSPMLSWVLPEKAAASSTYEVQLADNPNFTSAQTFSSTKSYLSVNGLNSGKGYFWKVRSKDGTGNTSYYSGTGQFIVNNTVTAVEDKKIIPTQFELSQNYPNPFNPTTVINYSLPNNAFVVLKIYDMLGREIKTLVNNEMNAGKYSILWKGEDNNGNKVTSGIYIYKISAGNYSAARKMVVLK